MNDNIYPGNGACETCGEVDLCASCTNAWMQPDDNRLLMLAQEQLNNILEIKCNDNLREKVNSILASVIDK